MSRQTLSRQVRQLERAVQAQPLDRSGRSVRPTDTGASHALHTRRALRDLAAANAPLARPRRRQSASGRRNAPPNHPTWGAGKNAVMSRNQRAPHRCGALALCVSVTAPRPYQSPEPEGRAAAPVRGARRGRSGDRRRGAGPSDRRPSKGRTEMTG
ncbi:hypothetical protein [Bacillus mycoides]